MKRILGVFLLALALMLSWNMVIADDFYVIPAKSQFTSWDKKIPDSTRFKLVLDGEAVLDRETGLVWERSPGTGAWTWYGARADCYQRRVGGRMGWRLPTVEELTSLVDYSNSNPSLPANDPFNNVQSSYYWSSTSSSDTGAFFVNFYSGSIDVGDKSNTPYRYQWCVRGGYGHDGY